MVVHELRQKYPLRILLQIADLSRSTYYYNIASKDKDEKNKEIIDAIFAIFEKHNGMYGYRRIAAELRNSGQIVNVKKVRRLMRREGLRAKQREKKKYSSYKGTVGTVAENLIQRNFVASHPNEKWFTDVTEFNLRGEKCYLSPIMDAYGQAIVASNISRTPNLKQVYEMLNDAFSNNPDLEGLVFHSDQGWQYQHDTYVARLKSKGILQSMSRKGNSMDNGLMENFFGILKCEMFYGQEDKYETIDDLMRAINEHIDYYNNDRIKLKLNGRTPAQFRNSSIKSY